MSILFSIGPINFDWGSLIAFGFGILFGFLLLLLIYVIAILSSLNKNLRIRKAQEEDIDITEIVWLIDAAKEEFNDKKTRDEVGFLMHIMGISRQLTKDVSTKFFPESSAPELELTIDEILQLGHYVSDRIDGLLDTRLLRPFKGMTIKRIMEMKSLMDKADEKLFDPLEKSGAKKTVKAFFSALNIVNPVYWVRKLTMDRILSILINRVGISIITIIGEETYKIYSKKVFDEEKEIESEIDDIYKELEQELKREADRYGK